MNNLFKKNNRERNSSDKSKGSGANPAQFADAAAEAVKKLSDKMGGLLGGLGQKGKAGNYPEQDAPEYDRRRSNEERPQRSQTGYAAPSGGFDDYDDDYPPQQSAPKPPVGGGRFSPRRESGGEGAYSEERRQAAQRREAALQERYDNDFDNERYDDYSAGEQREGYDQAVPMQEGRRYTDDNTGRTIDNAPTAERTEEGRRTFSPMLNARYAPDRMMSRETAADDGYIPPLTSLDKGHYRERYKRRNRHPLRQWQKVTLTVTAMVVFFAVVITLTFVGLLTSRVNNTSESVKNTVWLSVAQQDTLYAEETAQEENLVEFTAPAIAQTTDEKVKVILLVASDQEFGVGKASNCDALMLLVIDHRYKQIKLISIMTELYARIPGYYSNKMGRAFFYDTAKGDYSISLTRQTVEQNLGVVLDNYVVVDYKALETLVNRLGGVTLELSEEEAAYMREDKQYGFFPRFTNGGKYTMSGAETLNYIRMRRVGDGSFDRALRQRKTLYYLIGQLKALSFMELSELTYAMLPLLPTDMEGKDAWDYYCHAEDISEYIIEQMTLPINGSYRYGHANVLGDTFDVFVTNYAFTAEALRDYIYNNDTTYQGGGFAEDVKLPSVAPLPPELMEPAPEQ